MIVLVVFMLCAIVFLVHNNTQLEKALLAHKQEIETLNGELEDTEEQLECLKVDYDHDLQLKNDEIKDMEHAQEILSLQLKYVKYKGVTKSEREALWNSTLKAANENQRAS